MPSTSEVTILPNAAPMITATAKSITLPRAINSLNSFDIFIFPLGKWLPISPANGSNKRTLGASPLRGRYDPDFSTYIRQFTALCQEVLLTYFYFQATE